jgi:hypothetical protein
MQMSDPDNTEYYDKAIKTLKTGLYRDETKEAEPIGSMKTHFMFDKMNAQLGRLYWLRARAKEQGDTHKALMYVPFALWPYYVHMQEEKRTTDKADRDMALFYLKKADVGIPSLEKERMGQKAPWREEVTYLKALLEPPGKMLPTGIPPAMKPEPKAEGFWEKIKPRAETKKEEEKAAPKAVESKPTENKAPEKKDEPKAGDKPAPVKEGEKKAGENKPTTDAQKIPADYIADEPAAPQQHLTYAQMQALLKQGKTALCQCPRCAPTDKAIGAKLVE